MTRGEFREAWSRSIGALLCALLVGGCAGPTDENVSDGATNGSSDGTNGHTDGTNASTGETNGNTTTDLTGLELCRAAAEKLAECYPDEERYGCSGRASSELCHFEAYEDSLVCEPDTFSGCVAPCVLEHSCDRITSDDECWLDCVESECGPRRDSTVWAACSTSDEVEQCLESTDCHDPPGDDNEVVFPGSGKHEACVDVCGQYLGVDG